MCGAHIAVGREGECRVWTHTPRQQESQETKKASVHERGIPLFRSWNITSPACSGHTYSGQWLVSRWEWQSSTFPQNPALTRHVSIAQSLRPAIFRGKTWRVLNCSFWQTVRMAGPYPRAFSSLLSCQLITRLSQWHHWFPVLIPGHESWTRYVRICVSTVIPENSDAN